MMLKDIVYILKNDVQPEELRYSLRSVERNFYHRHVWFFGGCPDGLSPDYHVHILQHGKSKWEKVSNTLREVCQTEDVSEDFWLFNDDFFIMQHVGADMPMLCRGTISHHIDEIRKKHYGKDSIYSKRLKDTETILRAKGYDTLDYALHCPMLINKQKALETLNEFRGFPMFRTLYGNHHRVGGQITTDYKIQDVLEVPEQRPFMSTNDAAFRDGKAGEYIRSVFTEKSKYEGVK